MIYAAPSTTVEIVADGFATGLGGTIGYRLRDNQGADSIARTTAGITEDIASSGVYRAQLTAPTTAGQYTVVWDSGGASPTYATEELVVSSTTLSLAAPAGSDLCTLAEVRAALELSSNDTSMDNAITRLIPVAAKAIAQFCDREFAPTTSGATRRFKIPLDQNPAGGYLTDLAPYDLRTVTTMTLHPEATTPTVVTSSDYQLQPVVAADGTYYKVTLSPYLSMVSQTAIRYGYALLDILGDWGFPSIPTDAKEAAIIAVRSWLRRDTATYAEIDPDMRVLQPDAFGTYKLPPASKALLDAYTRVDL